MSDKITIDINDDLVERVRQELIERLAYDVSYKIKDEIKEKVERSLKTLDQATINRTVTECLVAEHLGKLRVIDKGKE